MTIGASDLVGAIGFILITGSYLLNVTRRVDAGHPGYLWANLIGSVAMVAYSYLLGAWASVGLNAVWGVGTLVAIVRRPGK